MTPCMTPVATILKRIRAVAAGVVVCWALSPPQGLAATGPMVSLVISEDAPKPVQQGWDKLKEALRAIGSPVEESTPLREASGESVVVAGLATAPGEAATLLAELRLPAPSEPESLLIRRFDRNGQSVLLVAGPPTSWHDCNAESP